MSESGSMVNYMNTTHAGHNFSAFGHGKQSTGIKLNHRENNTRLYCFFSKNKKSNNKNGCNDSSHSSDKIAVRNSIIANKESSTLAMQEKSPKPTTITTIKLFDEGQPPCNIGSTSTKQPKSPLTITGKISAALSKFLKKSG